MARKTILIATILLSFAAALHANEKITVVAFEYPPIYQDKPAKGLSCDILIQAFKSSGIDVDISFVPVKRMIAMVSSGEALCGLGGKILFSASSSSGEVSVSEPILYVVQTFMYDAKKYPDGISYTALQDLKVLKIGVLAGSGIMKFLEQYPELTLMTNTIHEGLAKQLYSGRIDLWAVVDLTGIMYLKDLYPDEREQFRFTEPYNRGDVSVVFSKKKDPDGAYAKKFSDGLKTIKKNGTYKSIMAEYYGSEALINPAALTDDMDR